MNLQMLPIVRRAFLAAVMTSSIAIAKARQAPHCDGHLKPGGKWREVVTYYTRYKSEMPRMSDDPLLSASGERSCDQSFQRASDSVRFRISFCHVRVAGAIDSGKTHKIGVHLLNIREVRSGGRTVLDLSIRSEGCELPWGLIIREDELKAFKTLLKELSFTAPQD